MRLRLLVCVVLWSAVAMPCWASGYTSLNAGITASNEERYDDAIKYLSDAIASPDLPPALLPVAYFDRATAYMYKDRFADAVADCGVLLRLKSDWYQAYEACGAAHGDNGDGAGALVDFTAAIGLKPYRSRAYILRAFASTKLEKYHDAIVDDGKAIALAPDDAEGYVDRAANYDFEGRFELALADWTKSADLKPRDYRIPRAVGVDQWALGDYAAAKSAFVQSLRLAPGSPDALYAQIWLDIVTLLRNPQDKLDHSSLTDTQLAAWPGPVLKYYGGALQSTDVMSAAASAVPPANTNQACEADFYVGEWEKLHNIPGSGRSRFEDAVKICPHAFIEYAAASFELRRVKQGS